MAPLVRQSLAMAATGLVVIALLGAGSLTANASPTQREGSLANSDSCAVPAGSDGFERADPSQVELDPEQVQRAVDFATSRNAASVRVYRHNCLVGTSRLDPLTAELPNNVYSTTKGVVSMLAGRAERLGHLSLDDPIDTYLPTGWGNAKHRALTVRQLLTQSSGLRLNWPNEVTELAPDQVRYTLALPFDHEPGSTFTYGQSTVTLLAYVIERAVGQDLQEFAQHQLFDHVGIDRDDWFWRRDRAGNTNGYAHLYLKPTDMARLGHVMLHNGRWGHTQLINRRYIDKASTPSTPNPYYGYLFWINRSDHGYTVDIPDRKEIQGRRLVESAPKDMYAFVGFLDQVIFVIPSLDMVVVRTGYPGNREPNAQELMTAHTGDWMHEFFRILMRGVTDENIPDPGPYQGDKDIAFDPHYFADPATTLGALGSGPHAPENCTALGCDGEIAYEGITQFGHDVVGPVAPNHQEDRE